MKNFSALLFLLLMVTTAMAQKDNTLAWQKMGNNKGKTFYQIQQDFKTFWKDKTPVKGQGYAVFKRWETYMSPRIFPTGNMALPSTTYENYRNWERTMANSENRSITSNWTSLGPNSLPSGYDSGAGRVDFVRFDPSNSNTMYVGAPDGGLWKSTDAGATWTTNTDFLGVIGCADLAIDPTNTQIMYLATGNWESDRRSIGILKSTNGGTTWATTSLVWTAIDNYKIRRLLMDPTDPLIMMVATDGGVFRTDDGWVTNTNVYCCNTLYDMEFKPGDPNTVYAAGEDFWKSTDNGINWTQITSGLPSSSSVSRTMLAVTAANPAYVYAIMGDTDSGFLGLYRSTNSGTSFSLRSSTPNILQADKDGVGSGGQATHDLAIIVAPDDADWVTIGGINQWRSGDGGATWSILSYWLGNDNNYPGEGDAFPDYTHADIQDIQYLPGSSTTMFTTADGGIYKSVDDGATWTQITNNLSIAQQTNVAQSATTASILVTGLQDIGTIKKDGATWSVINGGDGESAFIDRTNDLIIVSSNPYGAHDLSLDGGITRTGINGLPAGLLFFSPISQDPVVATTVYAGGRPRLYKNTDFVNDPDTWVTLGNPPSTGTDAAIMRFAVAPSNTDTIFVIKGNEYDPTTLSRSVNGGVSFTNINGTLPVANAQMSNLTFSNTDAKKAWVTFSGYSDGEKVYKTTDGGATWTNISSGLPNIPINTIVYVNDSPDDAIYIGADIGIYYYDNIQASWTLFNTNLPNARVSDLQIFYPTMKLRAATYGRGTWESDISAVVPIELISFSGKNNNSENVLYWTSATESKLDHYTIERSTNGVIFESIGNVAPTSAQSSTAKDYLFKDVEPLKGINYYRLKITDLDGAFEYSRIIILYVEDTDDTISLFPNPATSSIEVVGLENDKTSIRLIDALGRPIQSKLLLAKDQINVSDLPNGNYFIEIQRENKATIVKRFVKQ